jgi:hypothetical protein
MVTIDQLKQQAGIQDNPDQEGLDLFAQLIIQECIKVVDIKRDMSAGCGYVTKDTGDSIVEHFGLR